MTTPTCGAVGDGALGCTATLPGFGWRRGWLALGQVESVTAAGTFSRCGEALPGGAGLGVDWRGTAGNGRARQGTARQATVRPGTAWQGEARQGEVFPTCTETNMSKAESNRVATEANGAEKKAKETRTRSEAGTRERVSRTVRLRGITDVMFDRYPGDNDTKLEPWQKLYLGGESGRTIMLPSANLISFLSAQNTDSAPKRLLDPRKYKAFALACGSFVTIGPRMIPFLRDDQPIEFGKFVGDEDPESKVYIDRRVARLEKGIPNPKVRPVLPLPWDIEFTLTLLPNRQIQEQQLLNIFTEGMICLGIGTFRGQFGKADVVLWE